MALQLEIFGRQKLKQAALGLKAARERFRKLLGKETSVFANDALARIKSDYLTGPAPDKLQSRTGRLRSSIRFRIDDAAHGFTVRFGTNVPYAAIHEFGGRTAPHIIEPKRGNVLRFQFKGRTVFARRVNHPGSNIRERPYLTPGIEDAVPRFRQRIDLALKQAAKEGFDGGQ